MVYGLVLVALALWLLIVGGARLATRFEYSSKAKRVLMAVGFASVGVAFAFIRRNWPEFQGLILYLSTAGLTLPVFILLANFVAELWRLARQREYDSAIARLRQSEEACLAELRGLKESRGSSDDGPKGADAPAGPWGGSRDRERELRAAIEQWEAAGGSARIRAMKVQEWEEELSRLTFEEVEDRRRGLEVQLQSVADPDRAGGIQAQLNLVRLQLISGAGRQRASAPEGRTEADPSHGALTAKERELEAIRSSLREWRRRKEQFLAPKIRLG